MNSDLYEAGMKIRRQVMGDEYVDRALAAGTDATMVLQELTTEHAWGTIWTRPGLPLKTRSLLNIALLSALGKPAELKGHIRGALRNGCTKEEIVEVLLQAAVYCGIPVGVEGYRIANEVFASTDS